MQNVRVAITITVIGWVGAMVSLLIHTPIEITILIAVATAITSTILLFVKPYYETDLQNGNGGQN